MSLTVTTINVEAIKRYFLGLQQTICQRLAQIDGKSTFKQHNWQEGADSSGHTNVIDQGQVFEKGAVNFSDVYGCALPKAASRGYRDLAGKPFRVLGVSVILHPQNPFVPTSHMNVRFFVASLDSANPVWWFGGGYDLTPCYGFVEDCIHWHRTAKAVCDAFDQHLYRQLKKQCDQYFFIKHHREPRGIGGLFFDDLNTWRFDRCFRFVRAIGNSFLPAYVPIVLRRQNHPFNQQHKSFQCYRRARYVEFNLVYDRGTLFGLQFGKRIESVLCSMPPQAHWCYNYQPSADALEAQLYNNYLVVKDWV